MGKKISVGLSAALILIAVTITFAITMSVSMRTYNKLIKDLPGRIQMYSAVSEVDEIIRKEYYGSIDEKFLNSGVAKGYAEGLDDPYSYYMTPDEYIKFYNRTQGKMSGIGISESMNPDTGYMQISSVFENSPAKMGGLLKGDQITEIDGERVTRDNYALMVERLEGERLTSVNISFLRGDTEQTIKLVRGYEAKSVISSMIGTIAYIKISDFYENTITQFQAAIDEATQNGATSIIFDVRNNRGTNIEYAAKIIDILVPLATEGTGAIATAVNSKGETTETFSSDSKAVTLPMVVLVNKNTQRAAELFACDLRDFGKAQLVGERTMGNATIQKIFRLTDGGALILTTAKILPYKGDSYDGIGLTPEHEVLLSLEQTEKLDLLDQQEDAQLQKALELLQ